MNAHNTTTVRKPKPANKIGWTEAPALPKSDPMLAKYSVFNKLGQVVCVACGHPPEAHDKAHRCIVFYDAVDEKERCEVNLAKLGTQRFKIGMAGMENLRRTVEDFRAMEEEQETRYGGPTRIKKVVAGGLGPEHTFTDESVIRGEWA